MSRETTFARDLHAVRDRAELGAIFARLCQQVAADLQRKGYAGRTIGIKLRYGDFRSVTRDQTVEVPTQDAQRIRQVARQCLRRVPLDQPLRLLGVRVTSLLPQTPGPSRPAAEGAATHPARHPCNTFAPGETLPLFQEALFV